MQLRSETLSPLPISGEGFGLLPRFFLSAASVTDWEILGNSREVTIDI